MRLDIRQTTEGMTAKVMPVTLTPTGMEAVRNKNDLRAFNAQGYLVRAQRMALFTPDDRCPGPTDK